MNILGIDPGYAIIGFGAINYTKNKFNTLGYGSITTPAGLMIQNRLSIIYDELNLIISKYKPDCLAIEKLYFSSNQKTVITVAQARGVILLVGARNNLPIFEYTPLQIKQSVVGYGRATKAQVISMTASILKLVSAPKLDDTADALAVAICHAHSSVSLYNI
ncbi:MAG: crossover junction endodeoxyribonuclease RuvC, partial [Oscillospiraceae bacterium]|nr:crossover junction endodeoxyribonuclease RuvC [Oscillospiraceae bacterium]